MQDLTVVEPQTPIPQGERSLRRVVHHKGDHLTFSRDQIGRLFWDKIRKTPQGCWEWTGSKTAGGYGRTTLNHKMLYTHRISYEIHKGGIPAGLHIDHLCRNRACANPAHLEAVTCAENLQRSPVAPAAVNAAKSQCPYGHEYTKVNTLITKGGSRSCRTCRRWRDRVAAAKRAGRPIEAQPPRETITATRQVGLRGECHQGHPFNEANTYIDSGGHRKCRACAREHRRRYNAKQSAAAAQ